MELNFGLYDLGLTECMICHAIIPQPEVTYETLRPKSKSRGAVIKRVVTSPHMEWHAERGDIKE